jgi:phosphate transport system substrate-binding protein
VKNKVTPSLPAILQGLVLGAASMAGGADFDLSSLQAYKPQQQVQGVVRVWGNDQYELMMNWESEFKDKHYEVRFLDNLLTTPIAFAGLAAGKADIGYMGHRWWHSDYKGFAGVFGYQPLEIKYAQGSFDEPGGSTPGPVIIVHKSNPLTGLTLDQLDGIFGAERSGGWDGVTWTTAVARGPEKNIRRWGQVGVGGGWTGKPIEVYGIDSVLSNWSDLFSRVVFKGGTKWNPQMQEIVRGGVEAPVDVQLVRAVHEHPAAIAFTFMKVVKDAKLDVKVIPIAARAGQPFVMPNAASFHDNSYPLNNAVYLYVNRKPGEPLSPRVREFLRYVLSREGQQKVANDKTWIPLSAESVAIELQKLD